MNTGNRKVTIVRLLKLAAFAVALFIVFLLGGVSLYQEQLILFPDRLAAIPPDGMGIEDVRITTADGETLHGWWMHGDDKARTVLFFHGNGGSLAGLDYQMQVCRKLGLNALVFDYRGFGESTGKINSEADLYRDGDAAWKFLAVEKKIPEDRIIVWGQSLGGGVAAEVAQNKNVAAVILDSTFYNMDEMAAEVYPSLPTGILLRYHLRTDRKLGNIHAPVLVIHSVNDGVIPFAQGEKVFNAANEPKEFLKVIGSHIGAYFDCEQIYLEGIRGFLDRNVRAQ